MIQKALEKEPRDPFFQAQAGKFALALKEYEKARGHLQAALQLNPEMVEAHWTMANLYRAMGEEEKQKIELAEINRLYKLHPPGAQPPLPLRDLFFSVGLPLAGKSAR